jgi:hypothetical protein
MLRFAFAAPLLFAAPALAQAAAPVPAPAPAPAQQPAEPAANEQAPPPEFIQAAQAFGRCIGRTASAVPATTTPEIGARQALAGCTAEKATMESRFESWVGGSSFPEVGRAPARAKFVEQMGQVETRIASGIREARAKAATTPPPAPAPAPKP